MTTNDPALAEKVRLLRNWGAAVKYHHDVPGYNSRLDTIQAAILQVKLERLSGWNEARRKVVGWYREVLKDLPALELPSEAPWTGKHAYHLFVVRLKEHDRDGVAKALASEGIETGIHYPIPIHRQKAYAFLGHAEGTFPVAEAAARQILSLPLFPEMTRSQVERVALVLGGLLRRKP